MSAQSQLGIVSQTLAHVSGWDKFLASDTLPCQLGERRDVSRQKRGTMDRDTWP